jgi:hypothetical protein
MKKPDGSFAEHTARPTKNECWERGFLMVSDEVEGFEQKYWEQWDKSIKAAAKLGYKIVKCKLVPVRK